MNRSLFAVVGLVLALTGCATPDGGRRGFMDFGARASNLAEVNVVVVNDKTIVVSQDPVFVQQTDTNNAIFWYLDPKQPYVFSTMPSHKGIDFVTRPLPGSSCELDSADPSKKTYVCRYNKVVKTKYPYMINLIAPNGTLLSSDPTVFND
jgi:hypothetical protein